MKSAVDLEKSLLSINANVVPSHSHKPCVWGQTLVLMGHLIPVAANVILQPTMQ